jgi:hypothetical protein
VQVPGGVGGVVGALADGGVACGSVN